MSLSTESALQDASRKLVEAHVYHCLSALFYALLHEERRASLGAYALDDFYCTDAAVSDDEDAGEVYEQWLVSAWLAHQLKAAGETVREFFGMQVWLRTGSGQALYMDRCFRNIVRALWRDEP